MVESPQDHHEHAAARDGGQRESVQPVVEQVPLVGQSAFVSALGGPQDDGETVQRAEEGHDGLPVVAGGAADSRVEFPVQRVADERVPESLQVELLANRAGKLGPVAQRAGEAQSAQRAGAGRSVQRATDGRFVQRATDGRFVQRAGDAGSVQRVADQSVVQRVGGGAAELLWPPPVRGGADAVVPLASATPLTVPGVQGTTNAVSVPPAVQRVVYDHPGLRVPSSSRTGAVPGSQVSAGQAVGQAQDSSVTEAPQEQVLSWSAGESFHAGPAVQRVEAESVQAVSLQQMFGGQATSESVVQRDEAPVAAVQAAPDQAAPDQAAPAQAAPAPATAAPGKAVSAAEVEELAKRLYEPLTAKLRAELWLDRERAGRVTDRWH
ncbi:hypothetical protein [Kribbella sp. NPDC006257]|uniref:hypothetical protein n=1 Tax=Kribbella sp. NPDC006257 TaxID=3156738 RepID=UPI0033B79618